MFVEQKKATVLKLKEEVNKIYEIKSSHRAG